MDPEDIDGIKQGMLQFYKMCKQGILRASINCNVVKPFLYSHERFWNDKSGCL